MTLEDMERGLPVELYGDYGRLSDDAKMVIVRAVRAARTLPDYQIEHEAALVGRIAERLIGDD